ncbi:DnaJ domain-containing protein [Pilobolus umbonatus]|nr:DnaJ domain-containing protein [Pilobolus umbonatus]
MCEDADHMLCQIRLYSHKRQSPFEVLSLNENATRAEIKQRYKELAKSLHPDKQTGDITQFQELVKAYELLIDPHKREYYMKSGYGWKEPSKPQPGYYHHHAYHHAYPNSPSEHHSTRFTSNNVFVGVLAAIVITLATVNIIYFQSSHAVFLSVADQHHKRSSDDLKKARTEAQLFGNDRGVKRVLEHRLRYLRSSENNGSGDE